MMATTRNFGNMGRSARSKAISRGPYVRGANPPRGACTSPTRAYVTLMRRRTCWQLADTKNSGLLEFAIEEIGIFIKGSMLMSLPLTISAVRTCMCNPRFRACPQCHTARMRIRFQNGACGGQKPWPSTWRSSGPCRRRRRDDWLWSLASPPKLCATCGQAGPGMLRRCPCMRNSTATTFCRRAPCLILRWRQQLVWHVLSAKGPCAEGPQ